jgi:ferredoxin
MPTDKSSGMCGVLMVPPMKRSEYSFLPAVGVCRYVQSLSSIRLIAAQMDSQIARSKCEVRRSDTVDGEDDNDVMWSDRSVSVGRSESGTEHCAMSECPRQAILVY